MLAWPAAPSPVAKGTAPALPRIRRGCFSCRAGAARARYAVRDCSAHPRRAFGDAEGAEIAARKVVGLVDLRHASLTSKRRGNSVYSYRS